MPNITVTQIPFSAPDIVRPGAGAEQWHNGSGTVGGLPQPQDVYYRFPWNRIEGATQGSYTWTYLDGLIRDAINKGQKFSFGIMPHRSDNGDGIITYNGARSAYPLYLHNLMQGEATNSRDFIANGVWVPNFNSPNYLARLRALHQAIRDHLISTTYRPTTGPNAGRTITLGDAVYCIDIRGFGNWGEWHTGDIANWTAFPTGRQPSAQSLKNIIDAHTQIFDRWPLVMMIAGFNGTATTIPLFHPYNDVAYHSLTARNAWGAIGFRRDQWGATDNYLHQIMAGNNVRVNNVRLGDLVVNKYKEAPITGEPMPNSSNMADLLNQVNTYHPTSIGDGNYGNRPTGVVADRVKEAFKRSGYRLTIEGGTYTVAGSTVTVTLNWKNDGIAPTYEDWEVEYLLKSGSNTIVTGTSNFKPKLFLGTTSVTDTFQAQAGTYTLAVRVVEKYRQPMPLFIEGRQSDGSYNLGTISSSLTTTTTVPPTTTTTTTAAPTTTTTTTRPTTTTTTTVKPARRVVSVKVESARYLVTYDDGSSEIINS